MELSKLNARFERHGAGKCYGMPCPAAVMTLINQVRLTSPHSTPTEQADRVQTIRKIGAVVMKQFVEVSAEAAQLPALPCDGCGGMAVDMEGFPDFEAASRTFIITRDFTYCKEAPCKKLAQYRSRRGEERFDGNTPRRLVKGDECLLTADFGTASADIRDEALLAMGPGAHKAQDLPDGGTVTCLDHTEVEFRFESVGHPVMVSVPYRMLTAVDSQLLFPGYFTPHRAEAAGFVGEYVTVQERNDYCYQLVLEASDIVLKAGRTCTRCGNKRAVGHSFCITYVGTLDGSKGYFTPATPEEWVCESPRCYGQAQTRTISEGQQAGMTPACRKCGSSGHERLRTCSSCKKIYYCSRECQRSDWARHKVECNALKVAGNTTNQSS